MALKKFQLLTVDIALGGDILNVVSRHEFSAVTYPELILLQYLHGGEQWTTNIHDCGYVEREDGEERKRLIETYGAEPVGKVFAGAGMGMGLPNGDNRYPVKVKAEPAAPPAPAPEPVLRSAAAEPAVAYGEQAASTTYTPREEEAADEAEPETTDVAGEAAPPRASRRPTPVQA
jgi:hypothetical protein